MPNARIFYAMQQIGFKDVSETGFYTVAHGVQSVGMTTNFDLTQAFGLGQLAIYENIEDIPDVEITCSKVLDGYPLLYTLATSSGTAPTLTGRQNAQSMVALSIFTDTDISASGTADSMVENSGMFVSSIGYNFPVDDNFTEDLTLVGNNKVWRDDSRVANPRVQTQQAAMIFEGGFAAEDSPLAAEGVNRRENLVFATDFGGGAVDYTLLPSEVFGITSSGTNEKTDDVFGAHITNISVSTDLGREDINELGRRAPYTRFANFPVEVTCEIEVVSISGDMISATEEGILTSSTATCQDSGNLSNHSIRIATCEGTRIFLGNNNKLSSVNYGGGDAGGGNVTVTYSYSTFNDFTVMHSGDPALAFSWANRSNFLTPA